MLSQFVGGAGRPICRFRACRGVADAPSASADHIRVVGSKARPVWPNPTLCHNRSTLVASDDDSDLSDRVAILPRKFRGGLDSYATVEPETDPAGMASSVSRVASVSKVQEAQFDRTYVICCARESAAWSMRAGCTNVVWPRLGGQIQKPTVFSVRDIRPGHPDEGRSRFCAGRPAAKRRFFIRFEPGGADLLRPNQASIGFSVHHVRQSRSCADG